MNFENGQIAHFGTEKYRIEKRLGFGAVAVVYQATPVSQPDIQVVIKLPKNGVTADPIYREGIRQEAQTLEILNNAEDPLWPATVADRFRRVRDDVQRQKRRVIALLDSGDFQGVPFLVQEMAPPEFDRFSILNMADEYRMLQIIAALTKTVALAHANGCAFKDFKPATKADRIRVKWLDDTGSFEFKIIDWNITGTEEDFAADLFMLGGHIYKMLLGRHVLLDSAGHPPTALGTGNPAWENLTLGTQQIVQRLLHRDEKKRYKTASDVVDDVSWWLEVLAIAQGENPFFKLEQQLLPKSYQREDRNLALAKLALQLKPPLEKQAIYKRWLEQSRAELEKEIWQPIAQGRSDMMMGAYKAAAAEFNRQLLILPKNGEPARVTRLFLLKAQLGQKLAELYKKDIRGTAEWNAVEHLIDHLVKQDWKNADRFFSELISYQTEIENWEAVEKLRRLIEAGILVTQAMKQIAQIETSSAYELSDWVVEEETLLGRLEKAIENLRKASRLAPLESNFSQQLQEKEQLFKTRQARKEQLEKAAQLIKKSTQLSDSADTNQASGNLSEALREFQLAKQQYRRVVALIEPYVQNAEFPQITQWHNTLLSRLEQVVKGEQSIKRINQLTEEIQEHLRSGEYDDAKRLLTDPVFTNFDNQQIQLFGEIANVGIELQKDVENKVKELEQQLSSRYGNGLENTEQAARALLTQSFTKPNLQSYTFVLRSSTKEEIETVIDRINLLKRIRRNIPEALARGDYDRVLSELGELKTNDIKMSADEETWYDQAQQAPADLRKAEELLDDGDDTENVFQEIEELIADKRGKKAEDLRQRLAEKQINYWQSNASKKKQESMQYYQDEIKSRELDDAKKAEKIIDYFTQLPEYTLGKILSKENLPPEVRVTKFSPLPAFNEKLEELKKIHEHISDFHKKAQEYHERHQFQALKDLLSSEPKEHGFSLTDEEEKWEREAEDHFKKLEDAKNLCESGLNRDNALQVINSLKIEKSLDAQALLRIAIDFLLQEAKTALDGGDWLRAHDILHQQIVISSEEQGKKWEVLENRWGVYLKVVKAQNENDSATVLTELQNLRQASGENEWHRTEFTVPEKQWYEKALRDIKAQLDAIEREIEVKGIDANIRERLEPYKKIPDIESRTKNIYEQYANRWRTHIDQQLERYEKELNLDNLKQIKGEANVLSQRVPNQVKPTLVNANELDEFVRDLDTVIGLQENQWQHLYDKPTLSAIKTNVHTVDETLNKLDTIPGPIKDELEKRLKARIAQQVEKFASNISGQVENLYENKELIERARELRWMQDNLPEIELERVVGVYTTLREFLKDKLDEIFTRFVNFDPPNKTVFTYVYDDLDKLVEISKNLERDVFNRSERPLNYKALEQWQNIVDTLKNIADTTEFQLSSESITERLKTIYTHCDRLKGAKTTLAESWDALKLSPEESTPLDDVFAEAEAYVDLLSGIQTYVKDKHSEAAALTLFEKLDAVERKKQEKEFSIFNTFFPDFFENKQPHRFSSWLLEPHRKTLREIIKDLPNKAEKYFSTVFQSKKDTGSIKEKILSRLEVYRYPFTSVYDAVELVFLHVAKTDPDTVEAVTDVVIARYARILTKELLSGNEDSISSVLRRVPDEESVVAQALQEAITQCNSPQCERLANECYQKVFGKKILKIKAKTEGKKKKRFGLF